jgi:hypothetical protein
MLQAHCKLGQRQNYQAATTPTATPTQLSKRAIGRVSGGLPDAPVTPKLLACMGRLPFHTLPISTTRSRSRRVVAAARLQDQPQGMQNPYTSASCTIQVTT